MVDRHILDMARRASDFVEDNTSVIGYSRFLRVSRLEIVQQVELEVINDRRIDLVSVLSVRRRRRTDLVLRSIQYHPRWSDHPAALAGLRQIRIRRSFQSHFFMKRAHHEFADGNG